MVKWAEVEAERLAARMAVAHRAAETTVMARKAVAEVAALVKTRAAVHFRFRRLHSHRFQPQSATTATEAGAPLAAEAAAPL